MFDFIFQVHKISLSLKHLFGISYKFPRCLSICRTSFVYSEGISEILITVDVGVFAVDPSSLIKLRQKSILFFAS